MRCGTGWGCRGGWSACEGDGKRETQNVLFGGAGGIRSLFQGHSPGGATVGLMFFGRARVTLGTASVLNVITIPNTVAARALYIIQYSIVDI